MSTITVSTKLLKVTNPSLDSTDFQVDFSPAIELGSLNYEIALLKLNTWYTSQNITSKAMYWSPDAGVTQYTITLSDGNYTIDDLNTLLENDQRAKGVTDVDAVTGAITYGIKLVPNYNTNRVDITIDNTVGSGNTFYFIFPVDSTSLASFLGHVTGVITTTTAGPNVPDVSNGTDAWQLRADIHRNAYDGGTNSDILYQFVPRVPPSANIEVEPVHLVYHQVKTSTIYSMKFRLTNQNNTQIDLAGEDMSFVLHLRPIKS